MFETIANEQGWSEATQIAVLLEYIENQQSDAVFKDFLLEKQDFENNNSVGDGI